MSKTDTQTAQTIHGDIEYDTAECLSCKQDVLTDETNHAVVFTEVSTEETIYSADPSTKTWEADNGNYYEGKVCDNCHDQPAGWPARTPLPSWFHRLWWIAIGIVAHILWVFL